VSTATTPVGIEHLAFEVDERDEVEAAYSRCLAGEANIHFPPEEDRDVEGYYAFRRRLRPQAPSPGPAPTQSARSDPRGGCASSLTSSSHFHGCARAS
jgi:hypothetical protein